MARIPEAEIARLKETVAVERLVEAADVRRPTFESRPNSLGMYGIVDREVQGTTGETE